MTWQILIPLIAQYGPAYVYALWKIISEHPEPTEEAWNKILALSQRPLLDYINEARAKVGLPPLEVYDPTKPPTPPQP